MWAKIIVTKPRFKPSGIHVVANNKARLIPVITSGELIDVVLMMLTIFLVLLLAFHIPKHVIKPIINEIGTTITERITEFIRPFRNSSFLNKFK
jgi:hypothetical protein